MMIKTETLIFLRFLVGNILLLLLVVFFLGHAWAYHDNKCFHDCLTDTNNQHISCVDNESLNHACFDQCYQERKICFFDSCAAI